MYFDRLRTLFLIISCRIVSEEWNSLPNEVREAKSISTLKNRVSSFLSEKP